MRDRNLSHVGGGYRGKDLETVAQHQQQVGPEYGVGVGETDQSQASGQPGIDKSAASTSSQSTRALAVCSAMELLMDAPKSRLTVALSPATLPKDFYSSTFIVDKMLDYLKEDGGSPQPLPRTPC